MVEVTSRELSLNRTMKGVAVFRSILTAQTQSAGLASALGDIFGLIPFILALTAILAFFMKELPLRKTIEARKAVAEELE